LSNCGKYTTITKYNNGYRNNYRNKNKFKFTKLFNRYLINSI